MRCDDRSDVYNQDFIAFVCVGSDFIKLCIVVDLCSSEY